MFRVSDDEIIRITENLAKKPLTPSSHLYKRFEGKTIGEASELFTEMYDLESKERPGLGLLAVVLSIHRNYTKHVEPRLNKIRRTSFKSFEDLKRIASDKQTFFKFIDMNAEEKYKIIVELLDRIDNLKNIYGTSDDYLVLNKWAINADYRNYKKDYIGQIKGIGLATFQHLRMNFGADTVKPDQRVKEVLQNEYKFYSNDDVDYICAVEYIAKVMNRKALFIDQVFVNYGSGYYVNKQENMKIKYKSQNKKVVIKINSLKDLL